MEKDFHPAMRFLCITLMCTVLHGVTSDSHGDDGTGGSCYKKLPSWLELIKLDNSMTGRLVFPEPGEDYAKYNFVWNLRFKSFPVVHAVVKSAEDIRDAILFAKSHDLPVTVKSSGHDFFGKSSADYSFVINLMDMKTMAVTPTRTSRSEFGELKTQTGATWKEIYEKVNDYGRVVVGGSAHTVTPGGYTLGGGHSPLSPSLGLAVDNLLEIQVVLADGRICTCTKDRTVHVYPDGRQETEESGDLFWAMQGGGGGTFGVVVYFVFKLHEARPMVKVTGSCAFYINTTNVIMATDALNAYNKWVTTAPPHWGGYFLFNNMPLRIPASAETGFVPIDLLGTFTFALNKFGPWDENTEEELDEFFEFQKKYPPGYVTINVENRTSFWDYERDVYDAPIGRIYTVGSLIPAERYNATLTSYFMDEFLYKSEGIASKSCTVIRLGGKVKEHSVNSSSVHPGWRSAQTCTSCGIVVSEADDFSLSVFERQAWLKDKAEGFGRRLRTFGNGEYPNEGDDNNPDWKRDYWGEENYKRLLAIKLKYDPENFFTCHHCVGSDIPKTMTTSTTAGTGACGPVSAAELNAARITTLTAILMALCFI